MRNSSVSIGVTIIAAISAGRQLFDNVLEGAIVGKKFDELLDRALRVGVFDFSNETRDKLYER